MKLKILFCGLGAIGTRHARLIQERFYHELFALRSNAGQEKNTLGIPELHSWDEVDRYHFDVAFITNPTYLHVAYAIECAERNMHLFIEKPIDASWTNVERLLGLVEQKNLTTYVAYPLRFHPVVQALKKMISGREVFHVRMICSSYLPRWRSNQNHLRNYSAFRSQGGGVVLDLSHEIDLVDYLFGTIEKIEGIYGRKSSLTVDSEDFADLIVAFGGGTANIHLNFFSHNVQRTIDVDLENTFVQADLHQGKLIQIEGERRTERALPAGPDDMFVSQLEYFFGHLDYPQMMNHLGAATKVFRKIVEFKEAYEHSRDRLCESGI